MQLFKTISGNIAFHEGNHYLLDTHWNELVNRDDLYDYLLNAISSVRQDNHLVELIATELLPPIGNQEIWAAGVTYFRSKEARMEESKTSGASTFYDLVYDAERPELFFKSTASRVTGPGGVVHIRKDSTWNVPEPELTLFINSLGKIQGYTVGNDMSSRSIEGENPLYLPQAKTYDHSASIGPCLYVPAEPIDPETIIAMEIVRSGQIVYDDTVAINRMKRKHTELVEFLFRECSFPTGCFLMTGTCLVPPNDFTLQINDIVNIRIDGIGVLTNTVGKKV